MPLPANSISIHTFSPQVGIITLIQPIGNTPFTLVATQAPHTFIVGQSVRFVIPPATQATSQAPAYNFGMPEINGLLGTILSIDTNNPYNFTVDIDTRFFQPFTLPMAYTQFAQAIPVGEKNSQLNGAWRNILGPQSPFGGENPPT